MRKFYNLKKEKKTQKILAELLQKNILFFFPIKCNYNEDGLNKIPKEIFAFGV